MNNIHNQAEIISIGTELLMGEIIDTNAKYLAAELRLIGIETGRATTAGDDKEQLTAVFREALSRTDLVLASGGLGPTDDDLTRDCLAAVLGETLYVDTRLEQDIRDYFTRSGRPHMPAHNVRQAMLISSASPVGNPNGTAPGWWAEKDGKTIVLLPGPPREMEPMWRNEIKPRLISRFPGRVALTRTLKVFGMSEATVNELTAAFFHLDNPTLGIYAKPDGIHLRFIGRGANAAGLIAEAEAQIRAILKEHIWGTDEDTMPGVIASLLSQKDRSLAVFDSGTGGALSSLIAGDANCNQYYRGGLVAASDELKVALGLNNDVLSRHGALSLKAAEAMAAIVRERFNADIGLSVTGISGIDGAAGENTGIACIGLADNRGQIGWRQVIIPRRDLARNQLAIAALFHLRERLLET